ncbi:hypothetical protein MARINON1_51477 [Marinobacter salarius]|nr:hypothetical protein MBHK15_130134 [Marinobacter salarius]VXB86642.1 hypothetical protein MARINON1_51477 [Marinobacter salarius]
MGGFIIVVSLELSTPFIEPTLGAGFHGFAEAYLIETTEIQVNMEKGGCSSSGKPKRKLN